METHRFRAAFSRQGLNPINSTRQRAINSQLTLHNINKD